MSPRCAHVLGYETTENHPGADLAMIEEMCALGLTIDSLDMHERAVEKRSTTRHEERLAKIHEEIEQENMNIRCVEALLNWIEVNGRENKTY